MDKKQKEKLRAPLLQAKKSVDECAAQKDDLNRQRTDQESKRELLKKQESEVNAEKIKAMSDFVEHKITEPELQKIVQHLEQLKTQIETCSGLIFTIGNKIDAIERELPALTAKMKSEEYAFWANVFADMKPQIDLIRRDVLRAYVACGKSGDNYSWDHHFFRVKLFGWLPDPGEVERVAADLETEYLS